MTIDLVRRTFDESALNALMGEAVWGNALSSAVRILNHEKPAGHNRADQDGLAKSAITETPGRIVAVPSVITSQFLTADEQEAILAALGVRFANILEVRRKAFLSSVDSLAMFFVQAHNQRRAVSKAAARRGRPSKNPIAATTGALRTIEAFLGSEDRLLFRAASEIYALTASSNSKRGKLPCGEFRTYAVQARSSCFLAAHSIAALNGQRRLRSRSAMCQVGEGGRS